MKNLIRMGVEKLSNVPIEHLADRPIQAQKTKWFGFNYHYRNGWYKLGHDSPYTIASRIIEKNIGKSFDLSFSYYCKLVPKMYQKEFLEEFEARRGDVSNYTIDENGNIQENFTSRFRYYKAGRPYRGPYKIQSPNYKCEYRHYRTGVKKPDSPWSWSYERIKVGNYWTSKRICRIWDKNRYIVAEESEFIPFIIQGFEKVFVSRQHPEFKRIHAEKRKAKRKSQRESKKAQSKVAYSFISKAEEQLKKEKEIDKWKVIKHGFDLETSFRTEKQTNPNLIKQKQ